MQCHRDNEWIVLVKGKDYILKKVVFVSKYERTQSLISGSIAHVGLLQIEDCRNMKTC